jgi:hypothetical protein
MKIRQPLLMTFALAVAASLWLGCSTRAQENHKIRIMTRLNSPNCVVHIRASWGNEGSVGTGVVIEENGRRSVLTAAHVIERGAVLEVVFGGREEREEVKISKPFHEFGIQYAQPGRDAAKLTRVTVPEWIIPARISQRRPEVGDIVTAYGLYDPDALRVRQARLVAGPHGDNEQDRVYVGVTSEPGDSGSPIFNEQGEVVAVLEGWEDWWDLKTQTRVESGPWGSRMEVRRWNERRKATRGPRLHDTRFRNY